VTSVPKFYFLISSIIHSPLYLSVCVQAPLVTEINLEGVEFTEIYEAHWGIFDSSKFHLEPRHVALSFVYSQSWRYFTHVNDQVSIPSEP